MSEYCYRGCLGGSSGQARGEVPEDARDVFPLRYLLANHTYFS